MKKASIFGILALVVALFFVALIFCPSFSETVNLWFANNYHFFDGLNKFFGIITPIAVGFIAYFQYRLTEEKEKRLIFDEKTLIRNHFKKVSEVLHNTIPFQISNLQEMLGTINEKNRDRLINNFNKDVLTPFYYLQEELKTIIENKDLNDLYENVEKKLDKIESILGFALNKEEEVRRKADINTIHTLSKEIYSSDYKEISKIYSEILRIKL